MAQDTGAPAGPGPAPERIEGVLEGITWRSEDTGFTVGRLLPAGGRTAVTVVGTLSGVPEGQPLRLEGRWIEHPRFGRQFEVAAFEAVRPTRREGILRYLSSGLVKGVGPELARRIVARFGDATLDVIDETPERLAEVRGIGAKRAGEIVRSLVEQREAREVMVFLRSHGIGQAAALKIVKRYGLEAAKLIRENPYRLADEILGIGFRSADAVAGRLGIARDSPERIQAGAVHVMAQAAAEGHTFLPLAVLRERCAAALGVAAGDVEREVLALDKRGEVVVEERPGSPYLREEEAERRVVYPVQLHLAETGVHQILSRLLARRPVPLPIQVERAVRWWEGRSGVSLAQGQREALAAAIRAPVTVITGGPGVGKTTIVRALAEFFRAKRLKLLLAAPTGRAAKRLAEATGQEAATIHRLLEFQPGSNRFLRDARRPLAAHLLLVDEASMVDILLAYQLLRAVPPGVRLVLVGDADQLPSVGPGNVLRDVIASNRVATVRLTEIFRQGAGSLIVENAHRIHRGELPEPGREGGDFYFVPREDPEEALATVKELVHRRIPERFGLDPMADVQVITPMYRGAVGADRLNRELQDLLNPSGREVERAGRRFRAGDKVMQVRNDYEREVFNGDLGRIQELDLQGGVARVSFEGRTLDYPFTGMDCLVPAYAVSVHRAQGSEYPAVVVPLTTQHFMMLRRNLLYTAVTRARRLVVVVGSRKALGMAVRNDDVAERHSALGERLRHERAGPITPPPRPG